MKKIQNKNIYRVASKKNKTFKNAQIHSKSLKFNIRQKKNGKKSSKIYILDIYVKMERQHKKK